MLRSTFIATIALTLFAGTCLSACNTADPQEIDSAGTVSLPLTAVGTSGVRYHLKAIFRVSGGALGQPISLGTSSDVAETELTAALDPGEYSIELNSGWQLMRADDAGGLAPVDAVLESAVVQTFGIKSKLTTTVTYRFNVNGQVVETGPGTLSVGIVVNDAPTAGGYYEFGLGHGYAWVATDQVGTTVSSKDFSWVTGNGPFCLKGEVAVSPYYESFAMVGINLNQAKEVDAPAGLLMPPPGAAIVYDLGNQMNSPLRILIQGADGATNANARWCFDLPRGASVTGAIPLREFNTECWSMEGALYAGEALASVAVFVPGEATMPTPYSFCVNALGVK